MNTLEDLRERLSRPSADLINDLATLEGDIVVLGAAGKLGPSLVELACRALSQAGSTATVYAVSRYSSPGSAEEVEAVGAKVVAADLADEACLAGLPDAANVVFLVGSKFGTSGREDEMWLTNAYLPGRVADRYSGSRLVALSTGNVYGLADVSAGGSREGDPPHPVGEYAMSCLGRERVLAAACAARGTSLALIRLNYAVEMRYGVLADIAARVAKNDPVDVTMGHVNVIWQGYANEVILRSLRHASSPPFVLNLTGLETLSVREMAEQMADHLGVRATIVGREAPTALLSDAARCHQLFGSPELGVEDLIPLTAQWVRDDRPTLGRPTKFDRRDGAF